MTDLQSLGLTGLPTKKDILRKRIQDGEIEMPVLTSDRRNLSTVLNKLTPDQILCVQQGLFETPESLSE
jgi:hypothetical protein